MQDTRNDLRLPASERLAASLLERIERGVYAPGEWLPTERELAVEFRADRSTIRRALSALAERRLIVREAGRRPRVAVRDVPVSHDRRAVGASLQTLAVMSPQTPHYPASPAIQRGALTTLTQKEAPYHLIVFDNQGETRPETVRRERLALEAIKTEGIRGAVVWHQGAWETLPDVRRIQEAGIPLVLVDRYDPALPCDFVGIDNMEAARDAVAHLLDLGHRRIAHLTMEGPTTTVREREIGYREAMQSRGIQPPPEWIFRMSHETRMQPPVNAAVDHFLSLPEPPTAVFVMNDLLAHSLMAELEAREINVPEQFSIMGFDDMDRDSPRPSPLTTVHQPFEQMGHKAVELLLSRLAEPPGASLAYRHVLLPTRLVIRSSCKPYSE